MITHFNEECKVSWNEGYKFSMMERLGLGAASMLGVSYSDIRNAEGISRTYYYNLRKKVLPLFQSLASSGEIAEHIILMTREFRERCVVMLNCYGNSAANIMDFFKTVLGTTISKGTIYSIIERAGKDAEEYSRNVSLENVKSMATDEVFQSDIPILTGVDLESAYIFQAERKEDRSAETWKQSLEEKKERGLNPKVNVSDGGSGLLKGVQEAFPEIEQQPDIFHILWGLGREVFAAEREEWGFLTKYCELEYRIAYQKTYLPSKVKYHAMRSRIDQRLLKVDSLRILYDWLREYTGFTGCGFTQSKELCEWILDEMERLFPKRENLLKQIHLFRKHLPNLLGFLPRLWRGMKDLSHTFNVPTHSFALLYHQKAASTDSIRNHFIEKKVQHIFRSRLDEARAALKGLIAKTYRASSAVENANGRFRVPMNVKRGLSSAQISLIQFYLNTKKQQRSRCPERIGTSALDRLTRQNHPGFPDLLLGNPHYIITPL